MTEQIKQIPIAFIKPKGGDGGLVFATGEGWLCEYPNGSSELLVEYKGLDQALVDFGIDEDGNALKAPEPQYQPGDVISHNVTLALLESLDMAELRKIGTPLGIKGIAKEALCADIAKKLGLSRPQ